jgi:hypothetical protein
MNDKPPSAISVAIIEMLLGDDDVKLGDEFDAAWGQAMFFLDPGRQYPAAPHPLVGRDAAIDILLEVSRAGPKTCDAVRALIARAARR